MSSSSAAAAAAVDEGTHLLLRPTNKNKTSNSSTKQQHAYYIFLSTILTRLGSRSWEFATPLLLLQWSSSSQSQSSLAAPAAFGLTCALSRSTISPWLGGKVDTWDNNRMNVVLLGTSMQAVGCFVSVSALIIWKTFEGASSEGVGAAFIRLPLLALVIIAGVVETLGSQLSSVAIKKEWVPIVFDDKNDHDTEDDNDGDTTTDNRNATNSNATTKSTTTLSFINTTMTNIDLCCAMFGPVLGGWVLQMLDVQRGFAAIAFLNVLSFIPEVILLRRVYTSCPNLQQQRREVKVQVQTNKEEDDTTMQNNNAEMEQANNNPWKLWLHHPSGLPLISISLACLYLTALSPNGVVLTAYLAAIGLSPSSIGLFRAIGSFAGVVGIGLFSMIRKWGEDNNNHNNNNESKAERFASVRSIEHLRRISLAFLMLEVISVIVAAVSFYHLDHPSSSSIFGSKEQVEYYNNDDDRQSTTTISWQVKLFLASMVVSRAGLYSFDVGALEIEQYIVDERYRNAVGSVEGALCSLAEMGMYVLTLALPNPAQFGWQVGVSATAVTTGGICFCSFLSLYHMHPHHHHHHDADLVGGEMVEGHHSHEHHHHHHNHKHTSQQEQDLKEFGYHIHLHRSSPSLHWVFSKEIVESFSDLPDPYNKNKPLT